MVPFYYLNLELDEDHNEEVDDISEYCNYYPNGDWQIECSSNVIKYKDELYSKIIYNNDTQLIHFYRDNEQILTLGLYLTLIPQESQLNPEAISFIPQSNIKENLKEMADMIDDFKDKINDEQYLKIMNLMRTMFNETSHLT